MEILPGNLESKLEFLDPNRVLAPVDLSELEHAIVKCRAEMFRGTRSRRDWSGLYFEGGKRYEVMAIYYRLPCPYGVLDVDGRMNVIHNDEDYPVVKNIELGGDGGMRVINKKEDYPELRKAVPPYSVSSAYPPQEEDTERVEQEGEIFSVRQMDRHLLFRDNSKYEGEGKDAWFFSDTTLEQFADAYRSRMPGRCIMYVLRCQEEDAFIYLFFEIDGTGFALNVTLHGGKEIVPWVLKFERVDFRWDDLHPRTPDVLSAPVEELHAFYDTLFEKRINPYLQSPYPDQVILKDVPLTWAQGSEQEFQRLVQAICITEPGLFDFDFDAEEPVIAVFRASTSSKRGGFLYVERVERGKYRYDAEHYTSRRMVVLSELAFRFHPCVGMKWITFHAPYPGKRGIVQSAAKRIRIEMESPSAHEKAEAFLTLVDWLDDKLYDSKKRTLVGLPPHTPE